jgi:hypothetical protein
MEDRDASGLRILLITNPLITGQKDIKLGFGQFQQFSILDSSPAFLDGIGAGVPLQKFA